MATSKKNHHIANTKNSVIRSILNKISENFDLLTSDTEKNIKKYFNNKCAYTGKPLKSNDIHFDHLIPCNKTYGGLYLPGNLVITSSAINLRKGGKSFQEFIKQDNELFETEELKEKKIKELEKYQKDFNYPLHFMNNSTEVLSKIYDEIESMIEAYVLKIIAEIQNDDEIILDKKLKIAIIKNNQANEIYKIHRKIPKWFKNPEQKNSQILIAFLKLAIIEKRENIKIDELERQVKHITNFQSSFKAMCEIYPNNNAKVFDITENGEIVLWKPISEFILEEYQKVK